MGPGGFSRKEGYGVGKGGEKHHKLGLGGKAC